MTIRYTLELGCFWNNVFVLASDFLHIILKIPSVKESKSIHSLLVKCQCVFSFHIVNPIIPITTVFVDRMCLEIETWYNQRMFPDCSAIQLKLICWNSRSKQETITQEQQDTKIFLSRDSHVPQDILVKFSFQVVHYKKKKRWTRHYLLFVIIEISYVSTRYHYLLLQLFSSEWWNRPFYTAQLFDFN